MNGPGNESTSLATVATSIEIYCRSLIGNVSPFIYFLLFLYVPSSSSSSSSSSSFSTSSLAMSNCLPPRLFQTFASSESCSHARFTCHQRHRSKRFSSICRLRDHRLTFESLIESLQSVRPDTFVRNCYLAFQSPTTERRQLIIIDAFKSSHQFIIPISNQIRSNQNYQQP